MKQPSIKHKVITSCAAVISAIQAVKLYKPVTRTALVVADLQVEIATLKQNLTLLEEELNNLPGE